MSVIERLATFFIRRKLEKMEKVTTATNKAWAWLEGKKTYLATALGVMGVVANLLGLISKDQMDAILAVAGFSAGAALADKGNRILGILKDLKIIGQQPETK